MREHHPNSSSSNRMVHHPLVLHPWQVRRAGAFAISVLKHAA